jgi:hypothetical protein
MHIFRHFFLSNYWWQKPDIWSQASYRYPISWEAFLDPSNSYFLFADFVDLYTHWTYICSFFVTFFSATIDGRNMIFCHNLHIGTQYCAFGPVRFILPVCRLSWFLYTLNIYAHFSDIFLSNYWGQKSNIWSQASYRYPISWEAFLDPSDSYFLFADLVGFYTHWTYMRGYHKWALAHSSSCFCITLY